MKSKGKEGGASILTMLNLAQAKDLAERYLRDGPYPPECEVVIVDKNTVERPSCYVFFYQSAEYAKTPTRNNMLLGDAPLLVDLRSGKILEISYIPSVEHYIDLYEKTGGIK